MELRMCGRDDKESKKFFCARPFTYISVFEDGNVYPCCIAWTRYSFGNFNTDSFDEIWNGERARNFRRAILDGSYRFCKKDLCVDWANKHNRGSFYTEKEISERFKETMDAPLHVDFCHDTHCNVRCVMCRDCQKHNSKEKARKLDEKIESIFLPMVQNASLVAIGGIGEALASDHSRNLIKKIAANNPKIKFDIRTNGLLANRENFEKLGIIRRVASVVISLHATQKDIYEKIVLDSNFDRIMENIEELRKMQTEGGIVALSFVSVVSLLNYKDMVNFAHLAKKYDAIVLFLEYENFGTLMGQKYKEMAVFNKKHPRFMEFFNILQEVRSLNYGKINYSPIFLNLKPISRLQHIKYRFDDFYSKLRGKK
jgi:MoaA/NifB/PqqE/SkfB family radical SAM enzyme